jgi:pimeloyl-[acyl-carrier protein] methyl ester esterase
MPKITLVLLPGLDGTGDLFEPFTAALGSEFKSSVMRYPADEPMDYSQLEALVRKHLPASEPFCLLGESFSGPIAISIAADPPPNLLATVLCCTFITNPQPRLAPLAGLLPVVNPRLAPLWAVSALLMGNRSTAALRTSVTCALAQVSSAAFRARLRAILKVNVTAKLARVQMPVLYLQASQDRLVPHRAATMAAQANPMLQIARLDGPHFLLQVCPQEASAAVGAFLRSLPQANHDLQKHS